MSNEDIVLKPKKTNLIDKIKKIFENKKRRYLYITLFILPFLIAMGIFGFVAYKEVKSLIDLATGNTEVKEEYRIRSMNYILRDNPTDIQFEYFTELKNAIESGNTDEATIAGLVCKNFITDFYTWTNKQGQYDVGGMYYVYDGESEIGSVKSNIYLNARDGFYKYLSTYIKQYGVENLIEVANVTVDKAQKANNQYVVSEYDGAAQDENEVWYKVYNDFGYDAYEVACSWSYVPESKIDTSKYVKKMNFIVINKNERFEIVEASEKPINVKQIENENELEKAEESYR